MKKTLLIFTSALLASGAMAQHYEWSCAQINNNQKFETQADAVANGFITMWSSAENPASWLGMPAQDLINNDEIVVSLPLAYNYVSVGGNKYSGFNDYAYKLILGMNNSTRDGIDPSKFLDGLEGNDYVRKSGNADQKANETDESGIVINDAIVKVVIPEGKSYGKLTLKTNRGGNLGVLYVIDQTKSQQVLLSASRCPDDAIMTHTASLNVQPGHTYWIMGSEKGSIELYAIEYDICSADDYVTMATEENSTSLWTCAQINNNQKFETQADAVAGGFITMWSSADNPASWLGMPAQDLINNDEIVVSLPLAYNYVSVGGNKFSGFNDYAYKLILGMNNSTRDGIDPTKFLDGLEGNDYVRTSGNADQKANESDEKGIVINDAIVKITVPETGTYGRVILNTNRGGNLGVLYVVDQTKSQQILLSASRCPDDAVKTHSAIFNVQPGHTYWVMGSEKGSIELYAIGYCSAASEKYGALNNSTSGIAAVTAKNNVLENNVVYNILGQRVNGEAKGLVFINGKKVIIRK